MIYECLNTVPEVGVKYLHFPNESKSIDICTMGNFSDKIEENQKDKKRLLCAIAVSIYMNMENGVTLSFNREPNLFENTHV